MNLQVYTSVLGKIIELLAKFSGCVISLPEKPESFQHLLLDLHLVCSKQLINSLHAIAPAAMPVPVALVSCNLLVLLLLVYSFTCRDARYQFQPIDSSLHQDPGLVFS